MEKVNIANADCLAATKLCAVSTLPLLQTPIATSPTAEYGHPPKTHYALLVFDILVVNYRVNHTDLRLLPHCNNHIR